jgi:thiamine biosynthesis lipoprotein
VAVTAPDEVVLERVAMATRCTVRLPVTDSATLPTLQAAGAAALSVLSTVEATCTRFRDDSPLMVLNRAPDRWQVVPPLLFEAVVEAERAHHRTGGRFDPRVLDALLALGYDRTLPFGHGDVHLEAPAAPSAGPSGPSGPFRPGLRPETCEVRLGRHPIDLGGIGKGLAVRWAAAAVANATTDYLVDAGGDCACGGTAPGGGDWLVGVEDPAATGTAGGPIAVLGLRDRAVATSSIRLRRWTAGGQPAHHLIDPRTGRPGDGGLLAVTVVAEDAAVAETWSKALFLAGHRNLHRLATVNGLAALAVDEDGRVTTTKEMDRYLQWQRN